MRFATPAVRFARPSGPVAADRFSQVLPNTSVIASLAIGAALACGGSRIGQGHKEMWRIGAGSVDGYGGLYIPPAGPDPAAPDRRPTQAPGRNAGRRRDGIRDLVSPRPGVEEVSEVRLLGAPAGPDGRAPRRRFYRIPKVAVCRKHLRRRNARQEGRGHGASCLRRTMDRLRGVDHVVADPPGGGVLREESADAGAVRRRDGGSTAGRRQPPPRRGAPTRRTTQPLRPVALKRSERMRSGASSLAGEPAAPSKGEPSRNLALACACGLAGHSHSFRTVLA